MWPWVNAESFSNIFERPLVFPRATDINQSWNIVWHVLTMPNFWERLPIFLGIKMKALDLQISERMCRDVLKFVANNNYSINQCEELGRWKSTWINWSSFNSADLIETQTRIWSRVNKTWISLRFCPRCSDKQNENGARKCSGLYHRMTKHLLCFFQASRQDEAKRARRTTLGASSYEPGWPGWPGFRVLASPLNPL